MDLALASLAPKIRNAITKNWKLLLLLFILLVSYQIRLTTAGTKHLQTYDPSLFYRYTKYIVDYGVLPQWDEMSYYPPGRPLNYPPLQFYVSGYLYRLVHLFSSIGLVRFLIYLSAVYGAITVIPAYLLGKEFGNENAGLMAALFVGVSPAILTRSMAAFYDNDGIVVFFTLFSMYLLVRTLRKGRQAFEEIAYESPPYKELKKNLLYVLVGSVLLFITILLPLAKPLSTIISTAVFAAFVYFAFWRVLGKNIVDYALGTLGLVLFALAWPSSWYIPIIVMGATSIYFVVLAAFGDPSWVQEGKKATIKPGLGERISRAFMTNLWFVASTVAMLLASMLIMQLLGGNPARDIGFLFSFSRNVANSLIVNISVAELQPVDAFGGGWNELFARVSVPLLFMLGGPILLLRRDRLHGSILFVWTAVTLYSISTGIRFMIVFAPAAAMGAAVFLSEAYKSMREYGSLSPLIAFGILAAVMQGLSKPLNATIWITLLSIAMLLIKYFWKIDEGKGEMERISSSVALAAIVITSVMIFAVSAQTASAFGGGEMLPGNWEQAFNWLRDNTAKDSVVGSWWDPGHDINTYAERRNVADGAHCPDTDCKPGLNTRIQDLGKIFCTTDEEEGFKIFTKYRGEASEMYWIASDDLVGKFRWLQYFGCACDGTGIYTPNGQQKCPLYSQIGANRVAYDNSGNIAAYYYTPEGSREQIVMGKQQDRWVVIYTADNSTFLFPRQVIYEGEKPVIYDYSSQNNTLPGGGTVWVHPSKGYTVHIPPHLEKALFTRMFFYEEDLKRFEMVFKSNEIKIYKARL